MSDDLKESAKQFLAEIAIVRGAEECISREKLRRLSAAERKDRHEKSLLASVVQVEKSDHQYPLRRLFAFPDEKKCVVVEWDAKSGRSKISVEELVL